MPVHRVAFLLGERQAHLYIHIHALRVAGSLLGLPRTVAGGVVLCLPLVAQGGTPGNDPCHGFPYGAVATTIATVERGHLWVQGSRVKEVGGFAVIRITEVEAGVRGGVLVGLHGARVCARRSRRHADAGVFRAVRAVPVRGQL